MLSRGFGLAFASLLVWLVLAGPAMAHKLTVFAAVQGTKISGEAYFRGGAPVRKATVAVLGPKGEKLGETTTDEEGKFTFVPRVRCDHRLVASAGEGHAAEFTVAADELPRGLPAPENAALADKHPPSGSSPRAAPPEPRVGGTGEPRVGGTGEPKVSGTGEPKVSGTGEPKVSGTGVSPVRTLPPGSPGTGETPVLLNSPGTGETPVLLDSRTAGGDSIATLADRLEGIEKQVVKLREDLVRYEDRVRLHDVLGGIGCILGFMGLTFYFLGVRRREKAAAAKS